MLYIGTSGWQYTRWKRRFYPKEASGAELPFYADAFSTVELNQILGNRFLIIAADKERMSSLMGIKDLARILEEAAELVRTNLRRRHRFVTRQRSRALPRARRERTVAHGSVSRSAAGHIRTSPG